MAETRALGEFPSICGIYGQIPEPSAGVLPIRPHHYPNASNHHQLVNVCEPVDTDVLIGNMQDLCCEGINFLRNEATDIVAFVVADSQRLNRPGIPPHVPIAYAMRGPSFTNEILRKMLTDVRLCCQQYNAGIMCEITDGEFIKLVHTSENGHPLTHFQRLKAMFKYYEQFSRTQLVDMIVNEVHPPYTKRWHDIQTPDVPEVWKQHAKKLRVKELKKSSSQPRKTTIEDLTHKDKLELTEGSKNNRRLRSTPDIIYVQPTIPNSGIQDMQSDTDNCSRCLHAATAIRYRRRSRCLHAATAIQYRRRSRCLHAATAIRYRRCSQCLHAANTIRYRRCSRCLHAATAIQYRRQFPVPPLNIYQTVM